MHSTSRFGGFTRFWRVGIAMMVVAVLVVGGLIAVGTRGGSSSVDSNTQSKDTNGPAIVSATAASSSSYAAAAATTAPIAPARAANSAPVAAGSVATGGSVNRAATSSSSSSDASILGAPLPPQAIDQKIIRTATIQFTAKDVVGTQNSIWNLATELGGTVLTSNTTGTDDTVRAEIAIRVPTERYTDAMVRLRGYAVKVNQEQSSAQDVTEDYVDLQARQRNLEATVVQFQALLTKATTVDDTLKVQTQLNNAQSDLERIKGKLNYYDQRTAFSTISATILPVPPAKATPVTPVSSWSLSHSVREAWNRSVNGLQTVADAVITVGIGGWWLEIPLALAIFFLIRRQRRQQPMLAPAPAPIASVESGKQAGV
ncbi:MAG: DUF4349 domain-containing protein [Thermomicrobiales bacterium]